MPKTTTAIAMRISDERNTSRWSQKVIGSFFTLHFLVVF